MEKINTEPQGRTENEVFAIFEAFRDELLLLSIMSLLVRMNVRTLPSPEFHIVE